MIINIIETARGSERYRVEVDGAVFAPDTSYTELPSIIDRIYSAHEEELTLQIINAVARLRAETQKLKAQASGLEQQSEELLSYLKEIWTGRLSND